MNNSEDNSVGRRLRSGLKPNFNPDLKRNNRIKEKKSANASKMQLRILKSVSNDKKLWLPSTVDIKRLSPKTIKKYDKIFFFKHKKRLKAERALSKYSKIRQSLSKGQPKPKQTNSTNNESPKRMLLWTSPTPQTKQQTNHPLLRSHVKRLVKCDDRENSLMSLPEFCRNLDLISFNDINRMNTKQMKTSFNLRNIAKSDDYSVNELNQIEINYEYLIGCVDEQNLKPNSSQTSNTNQKKKKNKKNDKNLWNVTKVKKKYNHLEKQKQKLAELWKKTYLNTLSTYEMSSPMGQRMFLSLKNQRLEQKKVQSIVKKYDSFCGTRIRLPQTKDNEFNRWKTKRIEQWTTGQELSQNNQSSDCHQYSFTRRQRLEKLIRLKSGINWQSRLLALNCSSNAKIMIKKLKFCPFCGQQIDINHSCDNNRASDCLIRPDTSDGLKQEIHKNIVSNQRVLRNNKKIVANSKENEKKLKSSPKTKVSPKVKKLRICSIDLDKSL